MPERQHPGEAVRSYPNHSELHAVQEDRPAEDGRVAGEFVPPEIRSQDHHGIASGNLIFVLAKPTPKPRLDAEHVEVVTGNHHAALDPWCSSGFGAEADGFHVCVGDDTVVASCFVADVQIFAIGEIVEGTIVRGTDQSDDAAWMWHGIRPEN